MACVVATTSFSVSLLDRHGSGHGFEALITPNRYAWQRPTRPTVDHDSIFSLHAVFKTRFDTRVHSSSPLCGFAR